MKPRILYCGEFSLLNTGYAVYGRELLRRLYESGKYEIAELASYVEESDPRIGLLPWKVYPVIPAEGNRRKYNPNSNDQFGASLFNDVCIDFKPTVVIDIRDFWMFEHESTSPARPYFKWLIMPTVDSRPQSEQWLSTYASADAVFTYQDWSLNVLNEEGGGIIKTICSAPPVADDAFYPLSNEDKDALQAQFGFEKKIVYGTVMRNQGRKLFPALFESFAKFLAKNKLAVLYCHTSYPDMGWDIPKYLHLHGITNKVYFTYVCPKEVGGCGAVFPALFQDSLTVCPRCKKANARFSSTHYGVDNSSLALIYNSFDAYIQYSNSEGFGMPQVEAAACGVPIIGINFSAMEDILTKLDGTKIEPLHLDYEIETGCLRAIPCIDSSVKAFDKIYKMSPEEYSAARFNVRMLYEKHYSSWDVTAEKWMNVIDGYDHELLSKRWLVKPNIHFPSIKQPEMCTNSDYARYLISEVLGKPEYLNTYLESRLIRDLNYKQSAIGMNGVYFNEMSAMFGKPRYVDFNREIAYKHFASLCEDRNIWEQKRYESIIRSSL